MTITLSIDMNEEQANRVVDSIEESLEDGERWSPRFAFQDDEAESIRQDVLSQLEQHRGEEDL